MVNDDRGETHGGRHDGSHGGRPSSWASVGVIVVGFVVGGFAVCLGPSWVLFWVGVGIVVLGGIMTVAFGVFSDVVVDEPRVVPEIVHYSLFGKAGEQRRGGELGETIEAPSAASPQVKPHG